MKTTLICYFYNMETGELASGMRTSRVGSYAIHRNWVAYLKRTGTINHGDRYVVAYGDPTIRGLNDFPKSMFSGTHYSTAR